MSSDEIMINDLDAGPSVSWKDKPVGTVVRGRVVSSARKQQTDYDTGELLSWNDGTPRLQTVVVLELDDGTTTRLFARGGKFSAEGGKGTGTSLEGAIVAAVKKAGDDRIRRGATLAVTHSGLAKAQPRKEPAKLFTAVYEMPAEEAPIAGLFSDDDETA